MAENAERNGGGDSQRDRSDNSGDTTRQYGLTDNAKGGSRSISVTGQITGRHSLLNYEVTTSDGAVTQRRTDLDETFDRDDPTATAGAIVSISVVKAQLRSRP